MDWKNQYCEDDDPTCYYIDSVQFQANSEDIL